MQKYKLRLPRRCAPRNDRERMITLLAMTEKSASNFVVRHAYRISATNRFGNRQFNVVEYVTPPKPQARIGVSNLNILFIVEIPIITHILFVMWNDVIQIQHESIYFRIFFAIHNGPTPPSPFLPLCQREYPLGGGSQLMDMARERLPRRTNDLIVMTAQKTPRHKSRRKRIISNQQYLSLQIIQRVLQQQPLRELHKAQQLPSSSTPKPLPCSPLRCKQNQG